MGAFPAVDPIPLPAPVWLFVGLHSLTLVLHFLPFICWWEALRWRAFGGSWAGGGETLPFVPRQR